MPASEALVRGFRCSFDAAIRGAAQCGGAGSEPSVALLRATDGGWQSAIKPLRPLYKREWGGFTKYHLANGLNHPMMVL